MDKEKNSEISVVILTCNNQDTIKNCLESASWAGEIVIVDSFSSDKTLEIARQYTDKIWQRQWPGFFQQWNFAIAQATREWVFVLASDEYISPELKKEIEGAISEKSEIAGYFLPRKTYFLNKWIRYCGWYPDYGVRLFKKGMGKFDNRKVHESMVLTGTARRFKNPIIHYSYSTISDYIVRMNMYTSLTAEQMADDGVKLDMKNIKKIAVKKSIKTFWKMYVRQRGFLDGMHGFILCVLSAVYKLMAYAKYSEKLVKNE